MLRYSINYNIFRKYHYIFKNFLNLNKCSFSAIIYIVICILLINLKICVKTNQDENSKKIYNNNKNNYYSIETTGNYDYYKGKYKKDKSQKNLSRQNFNISSFESIWDFSNIPEHILKIDNFDEILSELASRKYKTCKASVIYHPFKKEFYFRNPLINSNSMKDYINLKCRDFTSRDISLRQRFLINKKDLEELLDNNQDSILSIGKHELTDIRSGLEMSLFPVKFYKSIQENNYSYSKYLLCYDSIKVLGIDSNSDNYYIITAMDKHRILHCNSNFNNKDHLTMNNFIKYTSYCDEFCNEDYIYFSNDLIKCKCEFYYQNLNIKNKADNLIYGNSERECYYRRKFDSFEKFSHPYEMNEKLQKIDLNAKTHIRFYFNILTIIFSIQLLYLYYFISGNNIFIRLCIFLFIISSVISYFLIRINFQFRELINLQLAFEIINDIYPTILILFFNMKIGMRNNCSLIIDNDSNTSNTGILSFLFRKKNSNTNTNSNQNRNSLSNNINSSNNTISNNNLNLNNINTNNLLNDELNANNILFNNCSLPLNLNLNQQNILNNYLKKVIFEYERIQFDKTNFKLCLLIILDLLDNIFREIRVNEIEITLRFINLFSTFFLEGDNIIINLYCFNVRLKLLMEFLSRFILYLVENLIFINVTIPLYIILGRPRDFYQYNDQLLFQLNYLTLKPNSERFSDNWFLEALNFHKIKNMILFLKICRYVILMFILSIALVPKVFLAFLNNILEFKFAKLFFSYVKIVYNMNLNYLYYEPPKKLSYFLAFPFFLIYLFQNIFLTKDTMKIFLFHLFIGLTLNFFEEKENKMRINSSTRRLSTMNLRSNIRLSNNEIPINNNNLNSIRNNSSINLHADEISNNNLDSGGINFTNNNISMNGS